MCSIARNLFCCNPTKTPAANDKVILQPKFKETILEKAHEIISNVNFYWPEEVRRHFIAKHNLEPAWYEIIIKKVSKPTSKIIGSLTTAVFLSKIIVLPPALAILGTSYWSTISVSLLSVAVYPVLILLFGAAIRGAIAAYHIVASNVHFFVLSRFFPEKKPTPVNLNITFENLTRAIKYDADNNDFYVEQDKGERKVLEHNLVKFFYENAYKLEKYNILLEGNRTSIEDAFRDPIIHSDPSQSFTTGASSNGSYIFVDEMHNQYAARLGLEQVCQNAEKQYYHKHLIKQLIVMSSVKAANLKHRVMTGLPTHV